MGGGREGASGGGQPSPGAPQEPADGGVQDAALRGRKCLQECLNLCSHPLIPACITLCVLELILILLIIICYLYTTVHCLRVHAYSLLHIIFYLHTFHCFPHHVLDFPPCRSHYFCLPPTVHYLRSHANPLFLLPIIIFHLPSTASLSSLMS